jgi:hypothetical protein
MVEFQIHDWTLHSSFREILTLTGSGLRVGLTDTGLWGSVGKVTESGSGTPFTNNLAGRTNVLVRYRRDATAGVLTWETWDVDGTNYNLQTRTITGTRDPSTSGGSTYTEGAAVSFGFIRVSTSLVPAGSRPPTTFGTGNVHDWKFDGNTTDTGSGGGTWTGSFTFDATPNQDVVSAIAKVSNTPTWAPFRPIRAGHADTLDGSQSFTMADDSADADCSWRQLSGPSTLIWSDRASCTPTVTGAIFGEYSVRLTATSSAGGLASTDLTFGAVAYDDNGVVIYPDERLYDLLGPTKVWTGNAWEWFDQRLLYMADLNWDKYNGFGGAWDAESLAATIDGVPRTGTVYVANGSNKVYGTGTNFLAVFGAGRAGPPIKTTDSANAQIAIRNAPTGYPYFVNRVIANVDSDTELTTESLWYRPTISAPGVEWGSWFIGQVRKGAGTVYVANGSATVTGIDTNLQAEICDGGTTPDAATTIYFVEAGAVTRKSVASCQGATQITLAAPYDGTTISSPGVVYTFDDWDLAKGPWTTEGGSTVNFYDIAAAMYRFYYASGWTRPRDAARFLTDRYWKQTATTGTYRVESFAGTVIRQVIDPPESPDPVFWELSEVRMADMWDSRKYVGNSPMFEAREDAYALEVAVRTARYDPDATRRATNLARVQTAYDEMWSTDMVAASSGGFYRNHIKEADPARVMTVTNGSATVTKYSGTDFPADYCGDPASFYSTGTLGVTNGSTAVTLTGGGFTGQQNKRLMIRGTLDGQPYSQMNEIVSIQTSTTATLRYSWPGTTGNAIAWRMQTKTDLGDSYAIETMQVNSSGAAIGPKSQGSVNAGAAEDSSWYWCTRDSGTQLTLDKPFTGDTSSTVYRRFLRGGQSAIQPYFQALLARSFQMAARLLDDEGDTVRAAGYRARAADLLDYITEVAAVGYSGGVPYLAEGNHCYPPTTIPNVCDGGNSVELWRSLAVEANGPLAQDYLDAPTPEKLTRMNAWFNAQFCPSAGYACPFASDGYVAELVKDGIPEFSEILRTKNFGQVFGAGQGYMVDAARVGGPSPPLPGTVTILPPPAGSEETVVVRIEVVEPTSRTFNHDCPVNEPCEITIDRRLGKHLYRMVYLDGEQRTLSRSGWRPLLAVQ